MKKQAKRELRNKKLLAACAENKDWESSDEDSSSCDDEGPLLKRLVMVDDSMSTYRNFQSKFYPQ